MRDGRGSLTATKLYYGFGSVAYGVKDNGFGGFLLLYYNQVLGLPASWVGAAIMIALVCDAISDPLIGYASDNLRSRWGRRHPFMYASVLPVAASYFLLWRPPAGLSDAALFAYLLLLAILIRTFITLYEIPSASLVPELTEDYDQRTSMLGYRYFFGWWGGLGMAMIAFFVLLRPSAEFPVGQLNPAGWRSYGVVASAVMIVAILVSAIGTHRHIPYLKAPPAGDRMSLGRIARELRETLSNRSFLALFASAVFGAMGLGLAASLNIYFNTYFWGLSQDQIGLLTAGPLVSSALALGAAPVLSRRLGKKRAAISVSVCAALIGPLPIIGRLLGAMPENGSPALVPLLLSFTVVTIALFITFQILAAAMIADIVEDEELRTGRRSEGVLFAGFSFVNKAVHGLGVLAAGLLLSVISFPEGKNPDAVEPAVLFHLGLLYSPLLAILWFASIACLRPYRISRDAHEANLRRLDTRDTQETGVER